MKALITGDMGFLGRHFTTELVSRGWSVRGIDTKRKFRHQDCREFFQKNPTEEFDLVVHCAAVVGGRMKIDRAPLATAVSLSLDAEMFRWASISRPRRVIYISSSAAYPVFLQSEAFHRPLEEDDIDLNVAPGIPDQVYGWSKLTGEVLAAKLRDAGVPVTVIRPFSGYGGDQDETYPFRAITDRASRREDPLTVWCGDCVRDWIHVDDVVKGALAVADSGTTDPVNLCTGRPTNFWEFASAAADVARYDPEIKGLSDKPQGVAHRVGDPTRMLTYYEPKITLEEGIRRAMETR